MSRERNVFGIVLITMCLTSAALVAGWFGAQRYFAQQAAAAPPQEAPTPAPAPRKKTRAAKSDTGRGAVAEAAAANDAATAAAPAPKVDAAVARADSEPSTAAAKSPPPAAENEPARTPASESAAPAPEPAAPAATDHADGRTIMGEVQRRTDARFYRYDGLLESYDPRNNVTEKRWTMSQRGSHGQSKSVVRFTAPPEVKGVALLIHNHPERASDQWMWTPAIERDRRIATQDRSTRFFGTDFSFEDLEERDVDQYDYSLVGNETIDGAACWKLQSTPKQSRTSQYTHSFVWVRKDNYVVARIDNFVKDEVIRRITYTNIENVQGIWTARQVEMAEPRRHTRTRLTLQEVKYNAPVKDEEFTLQAIRR